MIILGFDPGLATTGYGVIKSKKSGSKKFGLVGYGCILTKPGVPTGQRLKKIYSEVGKLIKKHRPNIISIENIYFFKNLKTAMPVSQAKGVILLSAAKKNIPVLEITPLEAKMAITGYGRADKKQTQKMVGVILGVKKPIKSDDAADALGIAICGGLKKISKGV